MKLDTFDEDIIDRLGYPFYYWAYYGKFSITEQDIQYLDNIKKHPCFQLILENYQTLSPIITWAIFALMKLFFMNIFIMIQIALKE